MNNQNEIAISGTSGDDSLTFSTLWSQTDAFAGGLQERDIAAGDTVVICLSNPRAFLVAFYGTLRNGSVPVTIPSTYTNAERTTVLNDTTGTAYVTDETPFLGILNRVSSVRVAITVDIDSRMGIDLSSFLDNGGMNSAGSRTGIDVVRQSDTDRGLIAYVGHDNEAPLGVVYTHSALFAAARLGESIPHEMPDVHHLGVLPLSNPIELMYGVNTTILEGGKYTPQPDWDPDTICRKLLADSIDRTFTTPEQYEAIRSSDMYRTGGGDGKNRIVVIETSTPSFDNTSDDVTRYVGAPETGLTHAQHPECKSNSVDSTLSDIETQTADTDDIETQYVTSPAMMSEYAIRPDLTAETIATVDDTRWIRTDAMATTGTAASNW